MIRINPIGLIAPMKVNKFSRDIYGNIGWKHFKIINLKNLEKRRAIDKFCGFSFGRERNILAKEIEERNCLWTEIIDYAGSQRSELQRLSGTFSVDPL